MNLISKNKMLIQLLLIIISMLVLMSFSNQRNKSKVIKDIDIDIQYEEDMLITQNMVNKLLIEKIRHPQNLLTDDLLLNQVEELFSKHAAFSQSNVYKTIDGNLNIVLKQKRPIARYYSANKKYYITEDGSSMPLSDIHTARVPLVIGNEEVLSKKGFVELLRTIDNDEVLKQNITGIQAVSGNMIILKSRLNDYDVVFGSINTLDNKLLKYKAFLINQTKDNQPKHYKTVNLTYKNQVVCTK